MFTVSPLSGTEIVYSSPLSGTEIVYGSALSGKLVAFATPESDALLVYGSAAGTTMVCGFPMPGMRWFMVFQHLVKKWVMALQ